jgi:hypothetical protein
VDAVAFGAWLWLHLVERVKDENELRHGRCRKVFQQGSLNAVAFVRVRAVLTEQVD